MDAPERVGGRYRLDEPLARGGMATVHRGHDEVLDRPVAVKLLRGELADDRSVVRRFRSEASRAASISHPRVVAIYDVGVEGATPYIVMELVEGGDLAQALARERPFDAERVARIGVDVADALAAAHAAGVVHRDIKPRNILLDSDGRARVADFGIARAIGDESLTRTGAVLGSVEYFSPEQARGEPATPASDGYALGVVLYELVTGERPFHGDTPYAVATARLRGPAPDPRSVRPDVPPGLAAIIRRALAPSPVDRFPSAAALRDELQRWLEDRDAPAGTAVFEPVQASSATDPPERRRPRRWVGALAVIGLLVLAVAGYAGMRAIAGEPAIDPVDDPAVITGPIGGEVDPATPSPSPTDEPATATPRPTPSPTVEPEATPVATPEATAPPTAAATPPPATPGPIAIAASPEDAVALFYRHVTNGDFDAAYALWSDRMKDAFPRRENLDERFADTASIVFSELRTASQSATTATVQANFTETYDNGGSRGFIGYWRLVLVDGAWLLDEPTY